MKKEIWKFPIKITNKQVIEMPTGAKMLTVKVQRGEVCIWCLVRTDVPTAKRSIRVIGTGNPIESSFDGHYIGTVQENLFVWHVFDEGII